MPNIKLVSEAHLTAPSLKNNLFDKHTPEFYSSPISPKLHELRARHEAPLFINPCPTKENENGQIRK